jgi:hypothetical protein
MSRAPVKRSLVSFAAAMLLSLAALSPTSLVDGQGAGRPRPTPTPTPKPRSTPRRAPAEKRPPIQPSTNQLPTPSPTQTVTDCENGSQTSESGSGARAGVVNPAFPGFETIRVYVHADNTNSGWTNSGLVVRRGQRLRISASGRVSLGLNRIATPDGLTNISDRDKLMRNQPTGGLFAVIGDDNDDFVFIGRGHDFVSQRDGVLFLGVNEGNLSDNRGCYEVIVEAERIGPASRDDVEGNASSLSVKDRTFLKNGSVLDEWVVYKFEQDSFKIPF